MNTEGEKLIPINIVDEMKSSYIDYVWAERVFEQKAPDIC